MARETLLADNEDSRSPEKVFENLEIEAMKQLRSC